MTKINLNPVSFPKILNDNFQKWKMNLSKTKLKLFKELYSKGQNPHTFLITCCDSRIDALDVFSSKPGEIFVLRNIANLIPRYEHKKNECATAAAIEYAVISLKVKNIFIMGHSNCGGVKAYYDNLNKKKPNNNLNNWLKILTPLNAFIKKCKSKVSYELLEKQSTVISIKNLLTYKVVKEAVLKKKLKIFALWYDIQNSDLEIYDIKKKKFLKIK